MSENKNGIKGEYERDLNHTWLNLETEGVYQEDYQMRMLSVNNTQHLLPVKGKGLEEKSIYRYEVSGKSALESSYESIGMKYKDMELFMRQFIETLKEVQNLLLNPNGIVLMPAYIYRDKERFYFCFCPSKTGTIGEDFHRLTEYFVKKTDYQDKDAVYLAYELHKASMEENYNIENVMEEIMEKKEDEMEKLYRLEDKGYDIEEDICLDDWEGERELIGSAGERKKRMWGIVGEKMHRRKKNTWGEWEGLDI